MRLLSGYCQVTVKISFCDGPEFGIIWRMLLAMSFPPVIYSIVSRVNKLHRSALVFPVFSCGFRYGGALKRCLSLSEKPCFFKRRIYQILKEKEFNISFEVLKKRNSILFLAFSDRFIFTTFALVSNCEDGTNNFASGLFIHGVTSFANWTNPSTGSSLVE